MKNLAKTGLMVGMVAVLMACDQKASTSEKATPPNENIVATANTPANSASETPNPNGVGQEAFGVFQFEQQEHDFGTIKEGAIVKHAFKFKNVGQAPLIVSDVKPQCGCTATNWTKEPIQPGDSGEIEVQFDSNGRAGQNSKSTTITANTKEGTAMLYFRVNVEGKPAGGPPLRQ
jgi:Protein of unknown function (DUF1573)